MMNNIPDEPAQLKFISPEGQKMEIPPEGALGLLALGAVGIKAWRQARKEAGEPSHWYRKSPENDDKTHEAEKND